MEASKSSSSTMQVSFVCQRCSQPLKLDTSFNVLDKVTIQELIAPLVTVTHIKPDESNGDDNVPKETFVENKQDGVSRKYIPPARMLSTESANSFTLIGEASDGGTMENLSRRLKVTSDLFDIMSGQTDVDHPLCEECTDTLLDHLDSQLNITENECQNYKNCLELLSQMREEEEGSLLAELRKLSAEEEQLIQELEAIEGQRKTVAEELARGRAHTEELEREEQHGNRLSRADQTSLPRQQSPAASGERGIIPPACPRYQKEYSEFKRQQLELDDELKSVDNQMRYAQIQLDKLKKTNVFNATFHICSVIFPHHCLSLLACRHSGQFGTINNFRLGRLPSVPVEWNEINAAWGQTVLLLHALANKMGLRFQRMDVEKGKIEDTGGSGGSYSIKTQFNSEEQWTKALKFMLTNLKWGLAWVSSQFYNK
ncbi:BECN1 protein, partial [Atractosteus spatula]|nr:BECN1 protein [Atractosteus spatula]